MLSCRPFFICRQSAHVWTNQCARRAQDRRRMQCSRASMHARLMNACSLSLTDDGSDRCAGPARPSIRPSVHGPRRFPSWRSNANVSAYAVPAFPWAKHCSSMASSWLMGMGSSWSGPLQFLRAECASKAVHVTVSEGRAKRPIFCRMLGSKVIPCATLVLVSPIQDKR